MEYIISPDELANELIAKINKAPIGGEGNKTWTDNVKSTLRDILDQKSKQSNKNLEVIYTGVRPGVGEFMLDLIAWDRTNGEGAEFAVECEWAGMMSSAKQYADEVTHDFYKLLVVKASTKLMIFASASAFPQKEIKEKIMHAFNTYKHHIKGERYVFIDFAPGEGRLAAWLEVPEDGSVSNLDWKKIDILSAN